MKLTQWIVCATVVSSISANALEWDATQLEIGVGASWAVYNAEGYPAGPLFNVAAGGSVPVLVEQHSRLTGLASVAYAPIYGQDAGEIGGNFSALSAQILLEHDFQNDCYLNKPRLYHQKKLMIPLFLRLNSKLSHQ